MDWVKIMNIYIMEYYIAWDEWNVDKSHKNNNRKK